MTHHNWSVKNDIGKLSVNFDVVCLICVLESYDK